MRRLRDRRILTNMYPTQRLLIEQWCKATVDDAVTMFHKARVHPDNEVEALETIAVRCANSAFQNVADTIVGSCDTTAKRYGELCYSRFKREIQGVVITPETEETVS